MKKATLFFLFFLCFPLLLLNSQEKSDASREYERILALVKAADTMSLSAEALDAKGLEVESGHLKIVWESGTVQEILWGNDKAGLFLLGKGSARYKTEDTLDVPVMIVSVRRTHPSS
jgi:hypothetical protein